MRPPKPSRSRSSTFVAPPDERPTSIPTSHLSSFAPRAREGPRSFPTCHRPRFLVLNCRRVACPTSTCFLPAIPTDQSTTIGISSTRSTHINLQPLGRHATVVASATALASPQPTSPTHRSSVQGSRSGGEEPRLPGRLHLRLPLPTARLAWPKLTLSPSATSTLCRLHRLTFPPLSRRQLQSLQHPRTLRFRVLSPRPPNRKQILLRGYLRRRLRKRHLSQRHLCRRRLSERHLCPRHPYKRNLSLRHLSKQLLFLPRLHQRHLSLRQLYKRDLSQQFPCKQNLCLQHIYERHLSLLHFSQQSLCPRHLYERHLSLLPLSRQYPCLRHLYERLLSLLHLSRQFPCLRHLYKRHLSLRHLFNQQLSHCPLDQRPLSLLEHDPLWYCNCGHEKYISVYNGIINSNGKRPAQDSELDLIAQNAKGERSDTVERVICSPSEADELAHAQQLKPSSQSMWSSVTRCVATMGNSVFDFLGKIRDIIRGDAHEAVDTRSYDAINAKVVVKRFKRQACLPVEASLATEPTVDLNGLPYFAWTNGPAKYIGRKQLMRIQEAFERQLQTIQNELICGGPTIDDVRARHQEGEDLELSIAIHQLGQQEFGEAESEEDSARIFASAVESYYLGLSTILEFITKIYTPKMLSDIKSLYPNPPSELAVGDSNFRMSCKDGADFLNFVLTLKELYKIDETFEEAITKILVDVNAIHKSELLPSWVECAGKECAMPGTFPTASVFDDIPVGQVDIEPRYALKFPSSDSPTKSAPPVRVRDFKAISRPKGILKKSKEWPANPSSPRYVSTPDKKRKLAFQNPVSKFNVPDMIPAKVMPIADAIQMETRQAWNDAHRNGSVRVYDDGHDVLVPVPKPRQEPDPWDIDPERGPVSRSPSKTNHARLGLGAPRRYITDPSRWELQNVEKDDREMGLQYLSGKYGTFLGDMRRDLQQRWLVRREPESDPEPEPEPQNPEQHSPSSQQAVSHPTTPYRAQAQQQKSPRLSSNKSSRWQQNSLTAKAAQPQSQPQTPEERRRAMDVFLQNSEVENQDEPQGPRELGPIDDLYIATRKLEDLNIARQIREEFEVAVQREVDERLQRELEEEARRKEEEERERIEQERRREEARLQAERARKELERKRELEAKKQREAEEYAALTGLRAPTRPIILPISKEWESKVDAIQSAAETTELTKTPDGQGLTRRDFASKLLPEKAWLNDNIIIGSILHVANYVNQAAGAPVKDPKCVAFTSFFWPRLESAGPTKVGRLMKNANVRKDNFLEIDTILIPICKGSHWTLAIVRPKRRTVAHIDSMRAGAGDEGIKAQLLEWVKVSLEEKFVADEWSSFDYKAPRQTNGWDCGVFTITNAACFAMGLDPNLSYTARQLTEQRRRLAAVLLNKGFTDELSLDGL
ncbi:hypothetical protein B0T19DRAFT_254629 [Cercophora scortea]|uniref:Ubiquitin-like protease family profile domain-containing protein n=1 Tax=Cercophora scortea TaxID=314031 RepID=A0AAE0I9U0_9PEZI|nr:hypothetical protein B0T19DRAFT_254629 [Cercophora scortea]